MLTLPQLVNRFSLNMKVVFLLLISLLEPSRGFLQFKNDFAEEELDKYASAFELESFSGLTVFVDTHSCDCKRITEQLLKKQANSSVIIDNGISKYMDAKQNFLKSELVLVFIETFDKMMESLHNLRYHKFWNNRAFVQFVICTQVTTDKFVEHFLISIWRENVFDFVLVYVYEKLEVMSYNRFGTRRWLNFTGTKYTKANLFPNKWVNVNGFEFNVGIDGDKPLNTFENGVWKGEDIELLKEFIGDINGIVKITRISPEKNFMDGSSIFDFTFVRIFPTSNIIGFLEIINPSDRDSLICLVPNAGPVPSYKNFFIIYDSKTFLVLTSLIIIVAIVATVGKSSVDFSRSFFEALCCLFGGCITKFFVRPPSTKVIFLSFIIFSLINLEIFQSQLTSKLLTNKFKGNIDSIRELAQSDLKVFVDDFHYILLPRCIKNKAIPVTTTYLMDMLNEGHPNSYILLESYLQVLLRSKKGKRSKFWRDFHFMREAIVPGFSVYVFPRNSPYVDEISKHFKRRGTNIFDRRYFRRQRHFIRRGTIDFDNFVRMFLGPLIGYILAAMVLILEIIWYKHRVAIRTGS